MRKLTEAMTNALQSATFDAKRVGTPYSDTDAIHTGWTMYSVNGRTLSAMVKRGLCMGDGGLTEAGMSARVEIMDAIAPLDFPQSAQPEECACSGTDNSWCPKHYPAPQFKDAEGNDTYSTPAFPSEDASDPSNWAPDMSVVPSECYYGDTRPVVGVFVNYVGGTEGICEIHAQTTHAGKTIYPLPVSAPFITKRVVESEDVDGETRKIIRLTFRTGVRVKITTYDETATGKRRVRVDTWNADDSRRAPRRASWVRPGGLATITPHMDAVPVSKPKSGKWDAVLAVKSPTGIYSLPSVDNFPNERAYQSAMENADDMCREQGFTFYGPEWLHAFKSSYALSLEIQAEEENNTRYVGVKQNVPGFQGVEHVHIAGCRDIAREMKRWGQKETDTFSYYAGITYADLTFDNWGDIASDNYADPYNEREAWLDMLSWMNDDLSGVKIMPCAQKMELGDTPFGPIVRDGAYYTIEESPIEESPVSEPISQSGVTDCTECGAHIMVNDITVPSQCEDGCPEDTRTPEDMADTMTAPLTIEAQLSVVVDGVTIDLGWHEFTLSAGQTEHDIPAMYGEKNGTWSRPGAPDWASVITVTATGACWH